MAAPHAPPAPGKPRLPASSSFEDQVRFAYFSPPPGQYSPQHPHHNWANAKPLGLISEAQVPSALDYGSREKALVPGPGSYETPDLGDIPLPEGGRLSRKPPQDKVRLDEYPSPPPGTYGIPNDPTLPRQLYGSFGKDPRVTKFIQDEVQRSKGVPAPGAHDVMDSMESMRPFCPEGGRYLDQPGRGPSYFDQAAKLADSKPGPDRYNMPGAIRPNKVSGKLVWRYQSETLAATKAVINKVVGTGKENPAPGHYTLPDPAPLAPSPVIRGRCLPHAMPHPFAYNCSPDHGGRFNDIAPLRDSNNGAQIFGRDFQRGGATGGSREIKARGSADEVVASGMPLTLAERDIEQPGETVRWRSGGFAALRKVKSSPIISRKEHPTMEAMKHQYPALSKFHGRHDKTFIPNASRRPEIVKTHGKSDEYQSLQKKKWQLGALSKEIDATSLSMLEPLNEGKLREEATRGLIDKAKFKMRMEGLSKDQQDLVLAELPGVLLEKPSPGGDESQFELFGDAPLEVDEDIVV